MSNWSTLYIQCKEIVKSPISDRHLVYLFVRICSPRSPGRNFRRIVIKFGYVVHINNISVKFVNGHSRSKVIDAMTSSMANSIIAIDSLIIIRIFSNSQDKRTSMLSNVMPNGAHFRWQIWPPDTKNRKSSHYVYSLFTASFWSFIIQNRCRHVRDQI